MVESTQPMGAAPCKHDAMQRPCRLSQQACRGPTAPHADDSEDPSKRPPMVPAERFLGFFFNRQDTVSDFHRYSILPRHTTQAAISLQPAGFGEIEFSNPTVLPSRSESYLPNHNTRRPIRGRDPLTARARSREASALVNCRKPIRQHQSRLVPEPVTQSPSLDPNRPLVRPRLPTVFPPTTMSDSHDSPNLEDLTPEEANRIIHSHRKVRYGKLLSHL